MAAVFVGLILLLSNVDAFMQELVSGAQALQTIGKALHTKKSITFKPDHPYSCTTFQCAGFDMLRAGYTKSNFFVSSDNLEEYVLDQVRGSIFEEPMVRQIKKGEIEFNGAGFHNSSIIFETPTGQLSEFHISWKPVNESLTDDFNAKIARKLRRKRNMDPDKCFYEVNVEKKEIKFKLAKLRMVVTYSKKGLFSSKSEDRFIWVDPTLTPDVVYGLLAGVVDPAMKHDGSFTKKMIAYDDTNKENILY